MPLGSSKSVGLRNDCKYSNQSGSRVVGAQRSEWLIAELNFLGVLSSHLTLSPWWTSSFPRLHLSLVTHTALFLSEPCLPISWPITAYLAPLCVNATDTHNTNQPKIHESSSAPDPPFLMLSIYSLPSETQGSSLML